MSMFDIGNETVKLLDLLSEFGKDENGGITRLLYTKEWVQAQRKLERLFKEESFISRYDEVGNLFGRLEGSLYKDETILVGSHVDTVKNGGKFDGQYGIIAGFIAMKYLKEKYGTPLRNMEVVSICEEEGSRFPYVFWGAKNLLGIVKKEEVENIEDSEGISFVKAMNDMGFNFRDETKAVRKDIKAFLEIHVEQGRVLEQERKSVGLIHSIVGQRRFTIKVNGFANHAGTTPMGYRKDAIHASSKMISRIMDKAISYGDPLVVTVGKVEVEPNIVNVVPGKAEFTIDTRHTNKEVLEEFTEEIHQSIEDIATTLGVKVKIDMWMDEDPVPMDTKLVEILQRNCEDNHLNYKMMHSGAGHDAQMMAQYVPTAMIFVPSKNGVSHSPFEFTEVKDLEQGVKALITAIYELCYKH